MFFLENEVLGLRTLNQQDVENGYFDWLNDEVVCKYNSHHKYPMTIEKARKYVEIINNDESCIVLAVIEKATNTHIGNISLQSIDLLNNQAEIAFLFGEKSFWNKGYATMAARILLNHAFFELGINRIYYGTSRENIGMQKIGEKIGFKKVGTRRQALYKNGIYNDVIDYDILKTEWNERNI